MNLHCVKCGQDSQIRKPIHSETRCPRCKSRCWDGRQSHLGRTVEQRFWSMVNRTPGCWQWTGSKVKSGYGQMHVNGAPMQAHRVSWIIRFGSIPADKWVLHHCDNPECTNPKHLYLGTHDDNMRDMASRNRSGQRGSRSCNALLTESDIPKIRQLRSAGKLYREIAEEFGVNFVTVADVLAGRTWKHV